MANPFPGTLLLSQVAAGSGGFKILGESDDDRAGRDVSAAGDVNGDGIADVIVGANYNDRIGGSNAGAAYVVYGRAGGPSGPIDLDAVALGTGGFKIIGQNGGDQAGVSVSGADDVNGDGLADLIVGARGAGEGAAYVIYGVVGGIGGPIDLNAVAGGTGGFKIQGEQGGDRAGISVSAAGDVNGDSIADLIVGASRHAGGAGDGAAYVVYGSVGGSPGLVDLRAVAAGTGGFKILGENSLDLIERAGDAVAAAGDVNGDGIADVIVGAFGNDSGGDNAGAAYVVYGARNARTGFVDLSTVAAGTGGFKIQGENTGDNAGSSVGAAGDVNGDGVADVIIGASGSGSLGDGAGSAYVVFGKVGGRSTLVDLDAVARGTGGFKIIGENGGDGAGSSVSAAGDVNGDGRADLIVGAPSSSGKAGAAYVVFGRAGGVTGLVDLSNVALGSGGFKIQGENGRDEAGVSVSAAGDLNGDGLADLVVGAYFNTVGQTRAGAAYVIYGRREPAPTPDADTLTGTGDADTVDLLAGNDRYDGQGGNDTIRGNAGADWLFGGAGDDIFQLGGSAGPDLVAPRGATVRNVNMLGTNGNVDATSVTNKHVVLDVIDGGDGNDTVVGSTLADVVVLSAPGSAVYAGQNANLRLASVERFELGDGDDVLSLTTTTVDNLYRDFVTALGGRGNDVLWGGAGSDRLFGEDGNDNLVGGLNQDFLTGGAGRDTFGFARNFSRDFIVDFTQGQDILRIKGFGPNFDSFAEISGAVSTVSDFDGDGQFDDTQINLSTGGTTIVLVNFTGTLTAADFQIVA